jgi:hypothetical protein
MIAKPSFQTIVTSLSFSLLFIIIIVLGAVIGFWGGYTILNHLVLLFERGGNNAMFPWLGLFYGVCVFLIGVIFCIKLFRRLFLQNTKDKLLEKPMLVNFLKFIPARLAGGFFAGLTIHALVVIVFTNAAIESLK